MNYDKYNFKYATLDWDGTIRDGNTLASLIPFFIEKNILDKNIEETFYHFFYLYKKHEITHDQLADYGNTLFAKILKGKSVPVINEIISEYMQIDKTSIFSFANDIFQCLHDSDIAPIIISGAPKIVLDHYKSEFGIHDIFAFDLESIDGVYTGEVLKNFGCQKKETVEMLIKLYNRNPDFAFGDSDSDYDMFTSAKKSFFISLQNNEFLLENRKANLILVDKTLNKNEIKKIFTEHIK